MKTRNLVIYTTLVFFGISAIGLWTSSLFKSKSSEENELLNKYRNCTNYSISQDPKAPSIGGTCKITEEDYLRLESIKNKSNKNLETKVSSNETHKPNLGDYHQIYTSSLDGNSQTGEGSRHDISLLGIQAAKYFGVDPVLVMSMMDNESDFVKEGISNKGACGPMQVMIDTARDLLPGITQERLCKDYKLNIEIGVSNLKKLLEDPLVGGSYKLAAAAYNGGLGAVEFSKATGCKGLRKYQCEKNDGYQETRDFVERVWTRYRELNQNY